MKPFIKKLVLAGLIAIVAISVSGCLYIKADELYRLPQASEEYLKLQVQINAILNSGAEFSPPTGGPNRQSVQLKDLDGDGANEAIAFFSVPSESKLKIYMFKKTEDDYIVADFIEGSGTAIESIRYADMDGDGITELVVGWQMSAALKHMSIYSIREFHGVLLAGADYNTISVYDPGNDGREVVVALRLPASDASGAAEAFALMADGEPVSETARLSSGLEKISRVTAGKLSDGTPALFVESEGKYDGGNNVTDICAYQNGSFTNVTAVLPDGISDKTVRQISIFCSDINKDGVMEVPVTRLLKAQSETAYFAIDWYTFNSRGGNRLALTTYHNVFDEWYLILPFDWRTRVSVRREDAVSGERAIVFSYITDSDGPYEDFLRIYKLTGDKMEERAELPGRQIILSERAAVYAFELLAEPNSFGLSFDEQLIKDNFRVIYSDWTRSS